MRLIMCKLHFKFDISHVNTEVDWVRDSKFYLLWSKPPLMVRITERTD